MNPSDPPRALSRVAGVQRSAAGAALFAELAGRVPDRGDAPVLVAVDGVDGAGKTVFADQLAGAVGALGRPVVRASVDDFHQPRAVRHRRGRGSPEGFWLDSFDIGALARELLDPFRSRAPGRLRWHDLATDLPVDEPPVTPPVGAVVVLDGLFLHPADPDDPAMRRYVEGQRLYFAECAPWERADVVVDNTDWTSPRLLERPPSDR